MEKNMGRQQVPEHNASIFKHWMLVTRGLKIEYIDVLVNVLMLVCQVFIDLSKNRFLLNSASCYSHFTSIKNFL